VTIPWDDHLPPGPPVVPDAPNARVGSVPPTPPPTRGVPAGRRASARQASQAIGPPRRAADRRGGQVWMVMAGAVVALALLAAVVLVTSAR